MPMLLVKFNKIPLCCGLIHRCIPFWSPLPLPVPESPLLISYILKSIVFSLKVELWNDPGKILVVGNLSSQIKVVYKDSRISKYLGNHLICKNISSEWIGTGDYKEHTIKTFTCCNQKPSAQLPAHHWAFRRTLLGSLMVIVCTWTGHKTLFHMPWGEGKKIWKD